MRPHLRHAARVEPAGDGRDRVGATQAVVMTRSAWATTPGSVLADATEVPSTADYGTSFVMPIGEDVMETPEENYGGTDEDEDGGEAEPS